MVYKVSYTIGEYEDQETVDLYIRTSRKDALEILFNIKINASYTASLSLWFKGKEISEYNMMCYYTKTGTLGKERWKVIYGKKLKWFEKITLAKEI